MARLPQPGGDAGTWGNVLNEYLSQVHKADGTLKDNVVTGNNLAPNSVTNAAIASNAVNATSIADGSITETLLATAVQTKLNAVGGTPDWNSLTNKPAVIAAGADQAAARAAIGAGTASSKSDVGLDNVDNTSDANKPISTATQTALDDKADLAHTHLATQISDSTSTGRLLLTASDAPTARTVIGAGTSNLALGTTSSTAKAGDYQPASTDISDSSSTGRAVLTAGSASAARTAIGAGTASTKADVGLSNVDNTSDANKPISTATQTALDAKADLVGGLVPTSQLPVITLTDVVVVADQAEMLALTTAQVQPGDVAIRTDGAGSFILTDTDPSVLSNWTLLNAPANTVTSVNGQQGTVTLGKTDVGLSNVDNTSDANKPISTATQTALDAKADLVGGVVPSSQLPALALTSTVTVASQAAMLALTTAQVQPGDIAVRTDGAGTFILTATDPSQLSNWTLLRSPTDTVTSVNSQTGNVVLTKSDVGLGNVDNTSDATKNGAIATLTNKTLTNPKINGIKDTNGNDILAFSPAATPANYLSITSTAASGGYPRIAANGSDPNVGIATRLKGNSSLQIVTDSGVTPTIVASNASDTNVSLNLSTLGTGVVKANGTEIATISALQTLTNKTIDATNNSVSNIAVSNLAGSAVVTASEGIGANNNDTTLPTSAAVKAYADSLGSGNSSSYVTTAVHNGTTDDRAALAADDTAAQAAGLPILLKAGTYKVSSHLTITSPVVFMPGATIKPDSGIYVVLAGGITASLSQVFDHSAGGFVVPQKMKDWHPAWWGSVLTDIDDSQAWSDMSTALNKLSQGNGLTVGNPGYLPGVTHSSTHFGQRIVAPAGRSVINNITLSFCDIVAGRGTSLFSPPSTASSTDIMLTLGDWASIHGVSFVDFCKSAGSAKTITCIFQQGYRTVVDDVYINIRATGSVGLKSGDSAHSSTTPVVNNLFVIGGARNLSLGSTDPGFVPNPSNTIGWDIQSPDLEATNCLAACLAVGIKGTYSRGGRMSNVHVFSNDTGFLGVDMDGMQITNLYLDTNEGWGLDTDKMDRCVITNIFATANGNNYSPSGSGSLADGTTGAIRATKSASTAQYSKLLNVMLTNNRGHGIYIDGPDNYYIDATLNSASGSTTATTTGLEVTASSTGTVYYFRGTDAVTPILDNGVSSVNVESFLTSTPNLSSIRDMNNKEILRLTAVGSAANNFSINNSVSGIPPVFTAVGIDTNININFRGKGTGKFSIQDGTTTTKVARFDVSGLTGARTVSLADADLYLTGSDAIVNTQTGTTYTLAITDRGKVVECNNASPFTLTVPLNSSVAFPVGTMIGIDAIGGGQVTVAAAGGVTIQSAGGNLKLTGQYSGAVLRKRATDTWILTGDLTP